ncbi:DUF3073 domain-containing protein [Bifidobacterium tsurumiense]|uniref:Uncharacterized protein n=1 Tax=Bifidobacterium tsurumiense TaxID=356829 RepID=A0A087EKX5_9BIFI|nr:DUF3073 domain-containing protein [Bifidobacterium tsurumiense]KFJ08426.1 hypothetical protein BITS_1735 [Bifidobacterium tsurumiense]MSS12649.1 DUF3073 domain-containing protein [Bifidobacterium tsurumiense]
MGRGRQKAKQQKIARKLKYLTTDTDYDELAKELSAQEPGVGSFDPFADGEDGYESQAEAVEDEQEVSAPGDDDLDEYAKWAAEAAAKATSGEMPVTKSENKADMPKPRPHRPIPMPMPSALKRPKSE